MPLTDQEKRIMQRMENSIAFTQIENSTFIWGAANIGRIIGRNQRQTLHLLVSGKIKSARKVGAHWVANRDALLRELGADCST